jgi:hypothetical protein
MIHGKVGSDTVEAVRRGLRFSASLVLALFVAAALIWVYGCGSGSGGGDGEREGDGGGEVTDNGNTDDTTPSTKSSSCWRYYKVVHADDPDLQYMMVDDDSQSRPLTIKGIEYSDIYANTPSKVDEVESQGGEMVPWIDNGQTTRRFNCVGWVFRELNCHDDDCAEAEYGGYGWMPILKDVYADFLSAGLLMPVATDDLETGDMCFFFSRDDEAHAGSAKHVAEVVDVGPTAADTTVRAPDGWTGVFDADLEADWFDRYHHEADCYRWVEEPITVPDEEKEANEAASCRNRAAGDPSEPNTTPTCEDGSVSVAAGQSVPIAFSGVDADGDDLVYVISGGPTRGSFDSTTSTYTPAGQYGGVDSITFVANDGLADSNVCMIEIDISGCPLIEGVCTISEQSAGLTLTYWLVSPPPYGGPSIPFCTDSHGRLLTSVAGGLTTVEIVTTGDWDENRNGWWDSQVLACGNTVPAGGILTCAEGVACDQACRTIEGTCTATEQSPGLTLIYLLTAQPPYTGPAIPYCEDSTGDLFTPTPYGLRNAEVIATGAWDSNRNGWWDSQVLTCGYDTPAGGILVVAE